VTVYLRPERGRLLMDIAADEVNTPSTGQVAHDTFARALRTP
jgi:hypothetical protein